MRVDEHVAWERDFPVKYLVVHEDEDGRDEFWGRCAGVEGMFLDKVPPPREVLTLRGCAPEGLLRAALVPDGAASALLGDLCVEVWDEEQPVQWWSLVDCVVVAQRPNRADPALVDVVVGAGVEEEEPWVRTLSATPRFQLFAGPTGPTVPVGRCLAVDGLFATRDAPAPTPLTLIGCEPAEPLLAVLRRPRKWERAWAGLWALDRTGRVMYRHPVGLRIETARPSVLGGILLDIELADGGDDRPPLSARHVWETWWRGVPVTRNRWAPLSAEARSQWLDLTAVGMSGQGPDRSGGVHHLDGTYVTDAPGLHCALGEALAGPGGYYGREWNAFRDCLHGGFGVTAPFTLVWRHADVARRALAQDIWDPERGLSYFEEIVQVLEAFGVTVVLR
ncbi:barstar family protein [Streptomyces sp. NPDC001904]|uniref:barstar family protein n=1 Tax=Streptomyces sp. NPDC001904 TaxID=3154531 RepID=UPI00331AEB62